MYRILSRHRNSRHKNRPGRSPPLSPLHSFPLSHKGHFRGGEFIPIGRKRIVYSFVSCREGFFHLKRADQISSKGTISVFKDPDSIIILMRACLQIFSDKALFLPCLFTDSFHIILKFILIIVRWNSCIVCVNVIMNCIFEK